MEILVAGRNHRKSVCALLAAFPHLRAKEEKTETTLFDPEPLGEIVKVLKPIQPLLRKALVKTIVVAAEGQSYRIPSLEMSLALVFTPMTSLPWSEADKYMLIADFMRIVDANPDMDLKELATFGELVYGGGGAEIVEMVRQVRAGEVPKL